MLNTFNPFWDLSNRKKERDRGEEGLSIPFGIYLESVVSPRYKRS